MKIPLVNLVADCADIQEEMERAVLAVMRSGRFILGDEVTALEKELADWNNSRFAIGVASGTDALLVALMALDLKPGDEVITTPFTFIATVEAIVLAGGKPVLVDINESDMNINPALIENKITPRTRAIVPVHLYGCPCDMDAIMDLAQKHNLTVIEDLAQALGATWQGTKDGSRPCRAGNFGAINCVSFFPAKNLGAMGDAGAVLFNDESYRDRLLALRQHGSIKRYYHEYIGVNARIDEMQAAILRIKLKKLDAWTARRQRIAALYRGKLSGLPVQFQTIPAPATSVYNQFTIVTDCRDELMKYLESNGIPAAIHYPLSLHQQPALKSLGYQTSDLPVSEKMAGRVLSLPIYPSLADDQVAYICDRITAFFERS